MTSFWEVRINITKKRTFSEICSDFRSEKLIHKIDPSDCIINLHLFIKSSNYCYGRAAPGQLSKYI